MPRTWTPDPCESEDAHRYAPMGEYTVFEGEMYAVYECMSCWVRDERPMWRKEGE